jgi:hypothetical protein
MDAGDYKFALPKFKMADDKQQAYLKVKNITGLDVELCSLETDEDILTLKNSFRLRFPVLMATIAKILLFRDEKKLANLLASMYELSIDEKMYLAAVRYNQWDWLSYVWAFGKNYLGARRDQSKERIPMMTYVKLFDLVERQKRSELDKKEWFTNVCDWKLDLEDNMLRTLLHHNRDDICLEYMGFYQKFLDVNLYLYALQNNNNAFMKGALLQGAFPKKIFQDEKVIVEIMVYLDDGSKTNNILNVLMLAEVTLWKNKFIGELIDKFDNFLEPYEDNRLLLSYNPMMSIALTADLLTKIA